MEVRDGGPREVEEELYYGILASGPVGGELLQGYDPVANDERALRGGFLLAGNPVRQGQSPRCGGRSPMYAV